VVGLRSTCNQARTPPRAGARDFLARAPGGPRPRRREESLPGGDAAYRDNGAEDDGAGHGDGAWNAVDGGPVRRLSLVRPTTSSRDESAISGEADPVLDIPGGWPVADITQTHRRTPYRGGPSVCLGPQSVERPGGPAVRRDDIREARPAYLPSLEGHR